MSQHPDQAGESTTTPDPAPEEFHLDPPEYDKVQEGGDWKPLATSEQPED